MNIHEEMPMQKQEKTVGQYYLSISSKHNITVKYTHIHLPFTKIKIIAIQQNHLSSILHLLDTRISILRDRHTMSCDSKLTITKNQLTTSGNILQLEGQYNPNTNLINYFNRYHSKYKHNKRHINLILISEIFDIFIKYPMTDYQIVPTYHNVFIDQDTLELQFNHLALTGIQLIIFQRSISKQQFCQIYPFLYKDIFSKKKPKRINYFMYQKLLALLILSMIIGKPILSEQNDKFKEIISIELAQTYVSQLSLKFKKILQSKSIKNLIQQSQKQSNLFLSDFFYKTLVEERSFSISKIKNMFQKSNINEEKQEVQNKEQKLTFLNKKLLKLTRFIWQNLDNKAKKYLNKNGIISSQSIQSRQQTLISSDYEVFLSYHFNLNFKSIYRQGKLVKYLLKPIFRQQAKEILYKIMCQVFQLQQKSVSKDDDIQNELQNMMKEKREKNHPLSELMLSLIPDILGSWKIEYKANIIVIESQQQKSIRLLQTSMHL